MESTRLSRARSVSEPSLQVSCGNFLGDRSRRSNLVYEKGRDKIAHWIGSWGYEEVCAVLHQLVTRCRYNQMGYLWTALSSIPHRDFIYAATLSYSSESKEDLVPVRESSELGGVFFPLSTPITRDLSSRLRRSRRAENKRLHRISSVVDICDGLFSCTVMEESDNSHREEQFSPHIIFRPTTGEWNVSSKLPDIQTSHSKRDAKVCSKTIFHSTSVQPSVSQSVSMPVSRNQPTSVPLLSSLGPAYSHHTPPCQQPVPLSRSQPLTSYSTTPKLVSSRILQPMRRHMTTPIPGRPLLTPVASQPRPPTRQTVFAEAIQTLPLPPEGLECAVWFSNLQADWQQQEILELIISNLDTKELYYLSILLMSRQYRDIVSKLPETLAIRVLSFVPAKTLLSQCCQVCHSWNRRCSSPALWEIKTLQNRVCLPMKSFVSWKQYFLDDLRLKRNWVKGKRVSNSLVGHTKRVRSVCLKEELMVSGSTDCTVRVWNLATNECMSVLEGHTKAVWCVQFYGKNMVISGAGDGLIKIWNYRTSTCERTLEFHRGTVWAIQQKGELLVSGAHDKLV